MTPIKTCIPIYGRTTSSPTRPSTFPNGHVLTPGRYVGAAAKDDDGEPFEEKMARLTKDLSEQLAEGRRLEEEMRKNLGLLGYDI